jgi:hypothetical protein
MHVLEIRPVAFADDVLAPIRRLDPDHIGAPVREMTHAGPAEELRSNRLIDTDRLISR